MNKFLSNFFQLIAPNSCIVCQERLFQSDTFLCEKCNLSLPRTHQAKDAYNNMLAKMFWARFPFERAAALFYYEAGSEMSRLIQQMKYFNNPELAEDMGYFAAIELNKEQFFNKIDALIPLPLAPKRLKQRGYNQSEKIAKGIARLTHLPLITNVVKRKTFTESQTHKGISERRDNVENAFYLDNLTLLEGKHILLIDDIITTGATIAACARVLGTIKGIKISIMSLGFTQP